MLLIPAGIAVVLLLLGGAAAAVLLEKVYLPRLGLSFAALHETGELLETAFQGAKVLTVLYGVTVLLALLAAVVFTSLYLTRSLFRHIAEPLSALVSGVERIQGGDLDTPIQYENEDEFKAACAAVDEMAARLKASLEVQSRQQQQKQELIAGMSHDLKSPLTSIRAYAEGLRDGVAQDPQTQVRYLRTICAKEAELERLAERLLSFARLDLDETPVCLEPLPFARTLQELLDGFAADGLDIRLGPLPDAAVLADQTLLARILENLLDNSRKYGAGHVWLEAAVSCGFVSLRVSDDGPGVAESQLEKIFELGYRTDPARQTPAGGSGIGLAVVKKAAAQMHGSAGFPF